MSIAHVRICHWSQMFVQWTKHICGYQFCGTGESLCFHCMITCSVSVQSDVLVLLCTVSRGSPAVCSFQFWWLCIKVMVFLDLTLYSWDDEFEHFREIHCFHLQDVCHEYKDSRLFWNGDTLHQTMWHIPEECNFPWTFSD